jgi:Ca2+-binding EF-hand superfamily protein
VCLLLLLLLLHLLLLLLFVAVFGLCGNEQGLISRASFDLVFRTIVRGTQAERNPRTPVVLAHLFDVFDADHSGYVDFTELTSGLSILCGGDAVDKVHSAFMLFGEYRCVLARVLAMCVGAFSRLGSQVGVHGVAACQAALPAGVIPPPFFPLTPHLCLLFSRALLFVLLCSDFDGDGYISLDEMQTYLASVFKMLYATQPGTHEHMGVSASELAAATAAQCFADADTNGDGRLSHEEFSRWCLASLQPSGQSPVKDVVLSATAARPSWVSLGEIRRLTNLSVCWHTDAATTTHTLTLAHFVWL